MAYYQRVTWGISWKLQETTATATHACSRCYRAIVQMREAKELFVAKSIDRRSFLSGGLKGAAGFAAFGGSASGLLAACGSSNGGSSTTNYATPVNPDIGISKLTPRPGGKVVIGTYSEVSGLSPASPTSRFDATGFSYANTVLDPLAILAQDGTVKPYLAQAITPNSSYDNWTIQMRPNVYFHDGTPCDADAVIANLHALQVSILTGIALKPIVNVSKVDNLTVSIQMSQPWVAFPAELTSQGGYMITPKYINPDGSVQDAANSNPVGTGPFVFSEWTQNISFNATKNPHYWRPGLPYLDAIEFRPIIDDQSREATLRSGGINLMHSQDPQNYVDLYGDSSFQLYNDAHGVVGEPSIDNLIMNCQSGPTANLLVRQALAYASDREKIRATFFDDIPELSPGLFPPGYPWYSQAIADQYPTFDLNKAKQYVAQYKAQHPGPLTINLSGPSQTRYVELMNAFQTMWQAAGIEITTTTMLQDTYTLNLVEGKYQVGLFQFFSAADPDQNYPFLSTTTMGPPGAIALNLARYDDPALEIYLQEGRTNPDPQQRITAYQNVNKRLVENLPFLFGWQTLWMCAADDHTMNFRGLTCPDGTPAYGFNAGQFFPTSIWMNQ